MATISRQDGHTEQIVSGIRLNHAAVNAHIQLMRTLSQRWRTWKTIHGRNATAICLGCIAIGVVTLDPVEKLGYEHGTVTYVGVREGDKAPGVRLRVSTADDRTIWLTSRAFNATLGPGSRICLLKTRGLATGRVLYRHALPGRCLP